MLTARQLLDHEQTSPIAVPSSTLPEVKAIYASENFDLFMVLASPNGPNCTAVRTKNSDSNILVMQPADHSVRHDAPDALNRARDRRILVQ